MHYSNGFGEPLQNVILGTAGWVMGHMGSKPLFAPPVRCLPRGAAAQNLDSLVPWLKQAFLHAGCAPSGPQTRARRNVARGVEVQRGISSGRRRAGPRAAPRGMISSFDS